MFFKQIALLLTLAVSCLHAVNQPFQENLDYLKKTTDLTQNPCDDFYQYACGNYKTNFPDTSTIETMTEKTANIMFKIFKRDVGEQELEPVKIAKNFFKTCMQASATVGFPKMEKFIKILDDFKSITGIAFPALNNNTAKKCSPIPNSAQLGKALGKLMEGKLHDKLIPNFLLEVYVGRNFEVKRGEDAYIMLANNPVKFCHLYKLKMLEVTPLSNFFNEWNKAGGKVSKETINATISSLNKLQEKMAKKLCAAQPINNIKQLTVKEVLKKIKTIDFQVFLQQYTKQSAQAVKDKVLTDDFKIYFNLDYYRVLDSFLGDSKICGEDLANLLYLQLISFYYNKKSDLYKPKKNFKDVSRLLISTQPRLQRKRAYSSVEHDCMESVIFYMEEVVDHLFVQEMSYSYNLTAVHKKIGHMTRYVLKGFQSMVEQVTWMSAKSKKMAEKKISHLAINLLHKKTATDHNLLLAAYQNLNFNSSWGLSEIRISMQQFTFQNNLNSLLETKFDRHVLSISATEVNAEYDPEANSINIPLAILQQPAFDYDWPNEYNFGAIGVILGHELSHGFDDGGVNFDEEGYLDPWLEPKTKQAFDKMGKCLVDEYSKFCNTGQKICVNGKYTLGENIADNAGIHAAFRGFHHMLDTEGKQVGLPPGQGPLSQLKEDQLFFLGFPQIFCDAERADAVDVFDPHSPDKFRVTGTVRNFPGFSNAFGCKEKKSHCNIWITPLLHDSFMKKYAKIN